MKSYSDNIATNNQVMEVKALVKSTMTKMIWVVAGMSVLNTAIISCILYFILH